VQWSREGEMGIGKCGVWGDGRCEGKQQTAQTENRKTENWMLSRMRIPIGCTRSW